jgi:hypothetical protein
MSLPVKKIYIDTKYKTADSVSNSNFKIELSETLLLPPNTVAYLDDVSIPHSWYTIEEDINDKLYLFTSPTVPDNDNNGVLWSTVQIEKGNYIGTDLAIELQTKIRAATANSSYPNMLSVSYNFKRNNIIINMNYSDWRFKLLTPNDLSTNFQGGWLGTSYSNDNPQDMNEIFGNMASASPFYYQSSPYKSNSLNLQSIRNIYIHSPNIGSFQTIGPQGERTIIKKVAVTANQNEMIFSEVVLGNDFMDCSKQTWKTLEFYLKDSRGNYINFHGSNLSFSIIFSRMNPEN